MCTLGRRKSLSISNCRIAPIRPERMLRKPDYILNWVSGLHPPVHESDMSASTGPVIELK